MGLPTRRLLLSPTKAKDCPRAIETVAALAAGADNEVLAARGYQIVVGRAKGDPSAVALKLLDSLPRAVDQDRLIRLISQLEPKLEGAKISPATLGALQRLVRTAEHPSTAQAAAAVLTRMRRAPREAVNQLAALKTPSARIRASAVCRGILSVAPAPLPEPVARLLEDSDESVKIAALSCARLATNPPPGPLLRMVTGGSPRVRAAAMPAFAATKTTAPDPYRVARFFYINGKSGEPGLAGAVAIAAARLVRRPSHWDVAKFFVLPATHAAHSEDRALSAFAVTRLLRLDASATFKYLDRLASDRDVTVRSSVVRAIESMPASHRRANAPKLARLLARLASDSAPTVAVPAIWGLLDPNLGSEAAARLKDSLPALLARGGRTGAMAALLWPLGKGLQPSRLLLDAFSKALGTTTSPEEASTLLDRLAELRSPETGRLLLQACRQPATALHAVRLACRHPALATR